MFDTSSNPLELAQPLPPIIFDNEHVFHPEHYDKNLPSLDAVQRRVKDDQQHDAFCRKQLALISEGGDASPFFVRDGLLYKYVQLSRRTTPVDALVVPASLSLFVVYYLHCCLGAGHQGRDKLLARVRESYFIPNVTSVVDSVLSSCTYCARSHKVSHPTFPVGFEVVKRKFELVSIDIMVPSRRDKSDGPIVHDYLYVLVIQCCYSRYLRLVPLKTKAADAVARAVAQEWILVFGAPERLRVDNAKEFTGALMKELCALLGIRLSPIVTYNPQSNGKNERSHQVIHHILRIACANGGLGWVDHLPAAQFAWNTSYSAALMATPYQVVFGVPAPPLVRLTSASSDLPFVGEDTYDEVGRAVMENQIDLADSRRDVRALLEDHFPVYHVGEKVWIYEADNRVGKTDLRYSGPWVVTDDRPSRLAYACRLPLGGRTRWVHPCRMKRFVLPLTGPSPPVSSGSADTHSPSPDLLSGQSQPLSPSGVDRDTVVITTPRGLVLDRPTSPSRVSDDTVIVPSPAPSEPSRPRQSALNSDPRAARASTTISTTTTSSPAVTPSLVELPPATSSRPTRQRKPPSRYGWEDDADYYQ